MSVTYRDSVVRNNESQEEDLGEPGPDTGGNPEDPGASEPPDAPDNFDSGPQDAQEQPPDSNAGGGWDEPPDEPPERDFDFDPPQPDDQDEPPSGFQEPPPPPPPCSDPNISRLLGAPRGRDRNELEGFDNQFRGTTGAEFAALIQRVADATGLNPGFLASNVLAETGNNSAWTAGGPLDNAQIGLDFWHSQRRYAGEGVTDYVITDPAHTDCTIVAGVCHFFNENGVDTGVMYGFPTADMALRAMANYLNHLESQLRDHVGPMNWDRLPDAVRFAITRLAYNPGRNDPYAAAQRAVAAQMAGRNPLGTIPTSGPILGSMTPFRTSVVRAAQAMHLSNTVFNEPLPCP